MSRTFNPGIRCASPAGNETFNARSLISAFSNIQRIVRRDNSTARAAFRVVPPPLFPPHHATVGTPFPLHNGETGLTATEKYVAVWNSLITNLTITASFKNFRIHGQTTVDIRFDNIPRRIRADSLIHRRVRASLRAVYRTISSRESIAMSERKRFPPWVKIRAVPECQRSTIRLDFCPEHLNYVKVGAEKAGSHSP